MKTRSFGASLWLFLKGNLLSLLFFVVIASVFIYGITEATDSSRSEARVIAENSIRRAMISCYALEGTYPSSYDYLKENYNLNIDEKKYIVHYEVIGLNIMPDITVIER